MESRLHTETLAHAHKTDEIEKSTRVQKMEFGMSDASFIKLFFDRESPLALQRQAWKQAAMTRVGDNPVAVDVIFKFGDVFAPEDYGHEGHDYIFTTDLLRSIAMYESDESAVAAVINRLPAVIRGLEAAEEHAASLLDSVSDEPLAG